MKGYQVKQYNEPVKRYCQTLELRDNPELIAEYRRRHSREKAWPEIRQGIREVVFWRWKSTYWVPSFS